MAVQLGTQGQAGFDQPFELLIDCHRRIEHFLAVITRVVEAYGSSVLDDQAHRALHTAGVYFRESAPRHTADEEDSLFPRLRALGGPEADEMLRGAQRLERDHTRADEMHAELDGFLRSWVGDGRIPEHDVGRATELLGELEALYREHIAYEDTVLFPSASKALPEEQVREIGREMALRRGLRVPNET
ncbi:MAG: hemerythrin domain-containing protein [Phycisphaerales bacterium]